MDKCVKIKSFSSNGLVNIIKTIYTAQELPIALC